MPEVPPEQKCPSKEELSAYFDHELSPQNPVEQHLKSCSKCRDYLDSLAKMDSSIKYSVNEITGTDEDIANRIKKRVSESLENNGELPKRKPFLSPVAWRAAVLLVIGCGIGYLLWEESRENNQIGENAEIQKSAHVAAAFSASSDSSAQIQKRDPEIRKNSLQINWRFPADNKISPETLLKQNNIKTASLKKTEKGWMLTCEFSSEELKKFIQSCKNHGFQLSTPQSLEPFAKMDGIIYCSMDFVE